MTEITFEKYEKDGKVAVLYSPGFGAGWSTWAWDGEAESLAMNAKIVEAFLAGGGEAATRVAEELHPDVYTGGAEDLSVEWIAKGTAFRINEYDGNESIEVLDISNFMIA